MDSSNFSTNQVKDYIITQVRYMRKIGIEDLSVFDGPNIFKASKKLDQSIIDNINNVILFSYICNYDDYELTENIKEEIKSIFRNLKMDLEEKFGYKVTFKIAFIKRDEEEDYDEDEGPPQIRYKIKYFFHLNEPYEEEGQFEFGYETDEEIRERERLQKEKEKDEKEMEEYLKPRQGLSLDDFISPPKPRKPRPGRDPESPLHTI